MKKILNAYPLLAVVAGILTIFASSEPSFGRVPGAPIALALACAGFALASVLDRRR